MKRKSKVEAAVEAEAEVRAWLDLLPWVSVRGERYIHRMSLVAALKAKRPAMTPEADSNRVEELSEVDGNAGTG